MSFLLLGYNLMNNDLAKRLKKYLSPKKRKERGLLAFENKKNQLCDFTDAATEE